MCDVIGVSSVDELFEVIPDELLLKEPLDLPNAKSEEDILAELREMSAKSLPASETAHFCGAGYYRHHVPTVVDHLMQRSEFLTAYTPYQPEVSQGTLQSIFEFQTYSSMLTGMDVANASMYDGATAAAEAVQMCRRQTKKKNGVVVSGGVHPHTADVIGTSLFSHDSAFDNLTVVPACAGASDAELDAAVLDAVDETTSSVVLQNPDVFGRVRDLGPVTAELQAKGVLVIHTFNEILSLGMVKSPGSQGADVVTGDGMSLGSGLSYGGPSVGIMACKNKYIRQLPGRLIGETGASDGSRVFTIALGTREQHIRREKATSNICTSAGIMATAMAMHLSLLGEEGFCNLARVNHENAIMTADMINEKCPKASVINNTFFNEFTISLDTDGPSAEALVSELANDGILAGVPATRIFNERPDMKHLLLVAASELTNPEDVEKLCEGINRVMH